jgi:hypothetical protein
MTLELKVGSWLASHGGSDEVRQTLASLRIILGDRIVTRVADDWSKSIREDVYVSAYPMALWFASSWWRLRWEPAPRKNTIPEVSWRMAHEMSAAGYGFLWPRLTFESDGERVDVTCYRTKSTRIEPIGYIEGFQASIPAMEFETAVDAFLDLVLARLDTVGVRNTELEAVWNEVRAERADTHAARFRRLEAMLGYEPDEAPEETILRLEALSSEAGEASVAEIATACSVDDPTTALSEIIALADKPGIEGRFQQSSELSAALSLKDFYNYAPWERGWQLARLARDHWKLKTDGISNDTLSELMEVDANVFTSSVVDRNREPIGLAIRHEASDRLKILLRKPNPAGRRFEAARFLGDYLVAPESDRWLPVTDEKTARQKVQRAFAAEFLCPIDALQECLKGDFSDEAIEYAGTHFQVSPLTVKSHLANNHLLRFETDGNFVGV